MQSLRVQEAFKRLAGCLDFDAMTPAYLVMVVAQHELVVAAGLRSKILQ